MALSPPLLLPFLLARHLLALRLLLLLRPVLQTSPQCPCCCGRVGPLTLVRLLAPQQQLQLVSLVRRLLLLGSVLLPVLKMQAALLALTLPCSGAAAQGSSLEAPGSAAATSAALGLHAAAALAVVLVAAVAAIAAAAAVLQPERPWQAGWLKAGTGCCPWTGWVVFEHCSEAGACPLRPLS